MDGKAVCETDSCLSDTNMINNINNNNLQSYNNLGWKAKNYTEFYGRKYKDGLVLRLGTFEPVRRVKSMSRLSNRQEPLPGRFNSLENLPGLI